jgi:hypothetical protein
VVATYIGVALYILLYSGYTLWERLIQKTGQYFVPLLEVDLDTDAVWKPGQGAVVRERDQLDEKNRKKEDVKHGLLWIFWSKAREHVY